MALAQRLPYIVGARFVSMRDTPIAGIDVKRGDIITDEMRQHLGPRRMRQLYESRWLDIAGEISPSTSDEPEPEKSVGLLASPALTPEHDRQLPQEPDGDGEGDGDGLEPVELPAKEPVAPVEPGPAAGVYSAGFGRWYRCDAAGVRIGDKMTKAQAEATSLPTVPAPEK